MFVEALVLREDLRALVAEALPLTIRLDDTGDSRCALALTEVLEIALVPERGIRLVCKARLHWPLLGIDAPLTVNALRVLFIPAVRPSPSGEALTFGITLERADISGVPSVLDDAISQSVNDRLAHVELSWDFSKTLANVVPLPILLEELDALRTPCRVGQGQDHRGRPRIRRCAFTRRSIARSDAGGDLAPTASDAATPPQPNGPGTGARARASPVAVSLAGPAPLRSVSAAGAVFFGLRSVASRW